MDNISISDSEADAKSGIGSRRHRRNPGLGEQVLRIRLRSGDYSSAHIGMLNTLLEECPSMLLNHADLIQVVARAKSESSLGPTSNGPPAFRFNGQVIARSEARQPSGQSGDSGTVNDHNDAPCAKKRKHQDPQERACRPHMLGTESESSTPSVLLAPQPRKLQRRGSWESERSSDCRSASPKPVLFRLGPTIARCGGPKRGTNMAESAGSLVSPPPDVPHDTRLEPKLQQTDECLVRRSMSDDLMQNGSLVWKDPPKKPHEQQLQNDHQLPPSDTVMAPFKFDTRI